MDATGQFEPGVTGTGDFFGYICIYIYIYVYRYHQLCVVSGMHIYMRVYFI